jgi:hypothetical protein
VVSHAGPNQSKEKEKKEEAYIQLNAPLFFRHALDGLPDKGVGLFFIVE